MGRSTRQAAVSVEAAGRALIRWSLLLIAVFLIVEAPRGEHIFDKIKYNFSLWAYATSLTYIVAAEAAVLNAALLKYYLGMRATKGQTRSLLIWAASGAAFAWLGCDKMFAVHERIAFALVKVVPSLHGVNPSRVDGSILALYGLVAIPICIAMIRSLLISDTARKYFVWGFIFMVLAVGHDATETIFNIGVWIFDGETFEKLFQMLSGWAFAAAFVTTACVLTTKILQVLTGHATTDDETITLQSKRPSAKDSKQRISNRFA